MSTAVVQREALDSPALDISASQIDRTPDPFRFEKLLYYRPDSGEKYPIMFRVIDPAKATPELVKEITGLEQAAWKANFVEVSRAAIGERIFGSEQAVPGQIFAGRVFDSRFKEENRISSMIFTARVMTGGDYQRIPGNYDTLARHHDPKGDTLLDYSVVTAGWAQRNNWNLVFPTVGVTKEFAAEQGIREVIAYSRLEPIHLHIQNNPAFKRPDFLNEKGKVAPGLVMDRFVELHSNRPSFADYVEFFGFDASERDLERILWGTRERIQIAQGKAAKLGSGAELDFSLTREELGAYFSFENVRDARRSSGDAEARDRFVEFHLRKIGDPFQLNAHQINGAQCVRLIADARPDDLRSMGYVALMSYGAP